MGHAKAGASVPKSCCRALFALSAECGDGRARTGRERRVLRSGGAVGAGDEDLAGAGEGETVEAGAAKGLAGGL